MTYIPAPGITKMQARAQWPERKGAAGAEIMLMPSTAGRHIIRDRLVTLGTYSDPSCSQAEVSDMQGPITVSGYSAHSGCSARKANAFAESLILKGR